MAFNYEGALKAGYTKEQIERYLANKKANEFDPTTLLPLAGGLAGSFIPIVGPIAGGALGAGGGEALRQLIKGEQFNLTKVGKEAAISAAGGAIGKVGGKLLGAGAKALSSTGDDAIKGAFGIAKNIDPTDANALEQVAKQLSTVKGVMGKDLTKNTTVKGVTEKLFGNYKAGIAAMDTAAASSTANVTKTQFRTAIQDLLESKLVDPTKAQKAAISSLEKQIFKGSTTASLPQVQQKILELGGKSGFKGELASALKGVISEADPAVAQARSALSPMLAVLKGGGTNAAALTNTVSGPIVGNAIPANMVKTPQLALGKLGMMAEEAVAPANSKLLQVLGGQGAVRGATGMSTPSTPQLPSTGASTGSQNSLIGDADPAQVEQAFKIMALQDLQKTGGKNLATIEKAQQLILGGSDSGKPLTEAQQARKSVKEGVQSVSRLVSNPNLKLGPIVGSIENLKAKLNAGDPDTVEFNTAISQLLAEIAKTRGGTSFTPNEQKLLESYAPKVGDSRQEIESKLKVLSQAFGN